MTAAPSASEVAAQLTPVVLRLARMIRPSSGELSSGHFSILATLGHHGPLRPSDLARIEHLAPPAVARAIGTLHERCLVRRSPSASDARSALVEITEEGARLLRQARRRQADTVAGLLADLGPDDLDLVIRALEPLERLALAVSLTADSDDAAPVPAGH